MNVTAENYVELAMRTKADQQKILDRLVKLGPKAMQLINALIGGANDLGELAEPVKKWIEYGKDDALDAVNMKEEVGDELWRLAQICDAMGFTMQEAMEANIRKLQVRYGDKYSDLKALNRDLDAEREALVGDKPKPVFHLKDLGEQAKLADQGDEAAQKHVQAAYEQAQRRFGLEDDYTTYDSWAEIYQTICSAFAGDGTYQLLQNGQGFAEPPDELVTASLLMKSASAQPRLMDGWEMARNVATWIDGQTGELAVRMVADAEARFKEAQNVQ